MDQPASPAPSMDGVGLNHLLSGSHIDQRTVPQIQPWNPDSTTSISSSIESPSSATRSRDTLSPLPRMSSRGTFYGQRRNGSTDSSITQSDGERSGTPTTFEPPLRSLFASSQPTSSISAHTAQASMSSAAPAGVSGPSVPFSGASHSMSTARRSVEAIGQAGTLPSHDYAVHGAEKDVDDPTSSGATHADLMPSNTSQALTSLFVAGDGRASESLSRRTTQGRSLSNPQRKPDDSSTIEGHLYHVGYRQGRHSDITVHAFGEQYRLHKLMLDRVSFFYSAFSGPWAESSANEMSLSPEDTDPNISKAGFELALKRIYGAASPHEEEAEAIGAFATACWLDMPDLIAGSVDNILRQMQPENLDTVIKLVTNSNYGTPGERILSSAKAMLCRNGWEMPYEYWDDIPASIIREVIAGDPFYVPGEWERWFLAVKLLNRRLRRLAIDEGLVDTNGHFLCSKPKYLSGAAIRPGGLLFGKDDTNATKAEKWRQLYMHVEVLPLLRLLDSGIHYVHLRFEQLQHMRYQKDILGVPVLPEKVISDALWMSMELRQRVLNAVEGDVELGLSEVAEEYNGAEEAIMSSPDLSSGKGKQAEQPETDVEDSLTDASHPRSDRTNRFWIPSTDVSCVLGGFNEGFGNLSLTPPPHASRRSQRVSASFEPADVAWPPDLGGSIFDSHVSWGRRYMVDSPPTFTRYPPFRFCAEFPNPRALKEKKRIYSQTVWYAGSIWNLYIQRVNTSRTPQLGIYLHRAKDRDHSDDPLALTVDDRIGQLERDMMLRRSEKRHRQQAGGNIQENSTNTQDHDRPRLDLEGISMLENHTAEDLESGSIGSRSHRLSHFPRYDRDPASTSSKAAVRSPNQTRRSDSSTSTTTSSSGLDVPPLSIHDDPVLTADPYLPSHMHPLNKPVTTPTIPPYTDMRSTIKTYFKIYSPSKGGRLLSVYESAPDSFTFGKSWGWKSSQMVLDDGFGSGGGGNGNGNRNLGGAAAGSGSGGRTAGGMFDGHLSGAAKEPGGRVGDGKLRYMVVIGNV